MQNRGAVMTTDTDNREPGRAVGHSSDVYALAEHVQTLRQLWDDREHVEKIWGDPAAEGSPVLLRQEAEARLKQELIAQVRLTENALARCEDLIKGYKQDLRDLEMQIIPEVTPDDVLVLSDTKQIAVREKATWKVTDPRAMAMLILNEKGPETLVNMLSANAFKRTAVSTGYPEANAKYYSNTAAGVLEVKRESRSWKA